MNTTFPTTTVQFDVTNENWQGTREYDILFLRMSMNYMNDVLRVKGHVLVNDVYDQLGIDRTPLGAITGWIYEEGVYIDFNLEDAQYAENGISFEMNPQGVVYNKIRTAGSIQRKQIRCQVVYPMFGDITGLEWAQTRLGQAMQDGLIQKWEFLSAVNNPSGIVNVRFLMTTVLEYPTTVAPEEQDEVIMMALEPLVSQIVRDTDATIEFVKTFNI